MKNYILFLTVIFLLGLQSCQEEDTSTSTTTESLNQSSPLSTLVSRVAEYPTANDNILDGTDCFAVLLPVTVTVNGITVNVDDKDNCENVQNIINQYTNDDDVVYFSFPIRLKYKNFQEVQVNSQSQYQTILANCPPNSALNAIECIDFNFPIVINAYNSATQTPNTFTIANNAQLYNFIQSLTIDDIYNFVYPLSMTKSNGSSVTFNTNSELKTGIESVIGTCNNNQQSDLSAVITNGSWYVSSFIDEGHDETYHFTGYNFTFASNGTVVAVKNTTTANGTWSNYQDSGVSKLDLNFDTPSLEELNDDWRVIEFSETLIKLSHVSGGNGETHYLNFTKN